MNRIRTTCTVCLLASAVLFAGRAMGQAADGEDQAPRARRTDARLTEARRAATEKRREWIRRHLTENQRDQQALAQLNAQLDALDDRQVDVAAARLLEQLDKRQSRNASNRATSDLRRALEAREALRRMAAARHVPVYPSPAGFFPVITVLPEGASLTASAVVSPDRRHVRVNVNPFFSSIGPVDTFNFYTGETRRLPELNPDRRQPPPVAPRYDGLRTRNDRAPRQ